MELKITKLNLKYSNLSKFETEGYLKTINDIKTYIYDVHNDVVGAVIIMQMNSSCVPVAHPNNELIYEDDSDDEDTPTFVTDCSEQIPKRYAFLNQLKCIERCHSFHTVNGMWNKG